MTQKRKLKKIVVLCGGSGGSELLSVLRGRANITAILPATDDGGSGGWCREKFNMIAPGDFRRALVALSYLPAGAGSKNKKLKENFLYRYPSGEMKGQTVGNLAIASFFEETGDFDEAIAMAAQMLDVRDKIYPATKKLTTLCAELEDSSVICGETHIDIPSGKRAPIKRLFTDPVATIHPRVKKAIAQADFVLVSVGDIYSSIIANLVIRGMPEALQKTKAKVIMFVNSVTKRGESDGFAASDFVKTFERYASPKDGQAGTAVIDVAIVTQSVRSSAPPRS